MALLEIFCILPLIGVVFNLVAHQVSELTTKSNL